MPQPYTMNNFTAGIDRNRNSSPPKDGAFYDLLNCYLGPGHTIKRRGGFAKDQAVAGGIGLTSLAGYLRTFYSGADTGSNALIKTHKIVCPDGSGSALSKVYYAAPIGGYLYVVAGFANGKTFHFYLDDVNLGVWTANTHFNPGDVRAPTVENGLHYQVTSVLASQNWAPGIQAISGTTVVQPSTPNGFKYECTALQLPAGITAAYTGDTEPTWPLVAGQTVIESITKDVTMTTPKFNRVQLTGGEPVGDTAQDWRPGHFHAAGEALIPKRMRGQGVAMIAAYNNEGSQNVNYTGNAEPAWSNVPGTQIQDGTITWTVVELIQITWTCQAFNTSAAAEPVWPTVPGNTIADGTVTWTAIGRNVTDLNCPQSNSVVIAAGKVWAIDPVSGRVKFCGVDNPRAWSTADGQWIAGTHYNVGDQVVDPYNNVQQCTIAGISGASAPPSWSNIFNTTTVEAGNGAPTWLNVGISAPGDAGNLDIALQAQGDTTPLSLGLYRGNLVVFTGSGFQVWQIDQDPANNAILDSFEGAGSPFLRTNVSVSADLLFATAMGIRSMSTVAQSGSLEPGDAGMPIDPLVTPNVTVADTFTPFGTYVPGLGQYWLVAGQNVYVLTKYPVLGVEGWSRYTLPWTPLYSATLNGLLYFLANDGNLYHYNPAYYQDDTAGASSVYTMSIIFPYVVLGRHTMFQPEATMGYKKQVRGVDFITTNPITFQAGYDESQPALLTAAMTVGPDDREGGIVPCEVMCDSFSMQFSHTSNQAQELFSATVWYDVLQQAVG